MTGEGVTRALRCGPCCGRSRLFFNVAAGLAQPLFDGARLQGQLDLQKGRQDELLQIYRKAVVNGFADVERALIAVQQTARRESLQREVVSSSRRAFQIAETRLREGTVDLVTVLNTQQTLFQAQDTLAQARLARLQAVVSCSRRLAAAGKSRIKEVADQGHPSELSSERAPRRP